MKIKSLMLASSFLILAFIHHSESASFRSLLMKNVLYEQEEAKILLGDSKETITNSTALESKRIIPTGPNPLHNSVPLSNSHFADEEEELIKATHLSNSTDYQKPSCLS
ncbi:hypothetical protein YC2023_089565 [Brassica napus]